MTRDDAAAAAAILWLLTSVAMAAHIAGWLLGVWGMYSPGFWIVLGLLLAENGVMLFA